MARLPSRELLAPGTTLGPFRIEGTLGRGGMGAVYRAVDERLGRVCALKVILASHSREPRFMERFRREARAAVAVTHPGVTRVFEAGELDGLAFMACELVAGGSLEERLRRSGAIAWREACATAAEIARALQAVHAAGFVHRDLKPANVLLDEAGRFKLTDFGLAKRPLDPTVGAELSAAGLTKTGELVGTPQYMSPEQINGAREVDHRADLYALGVLLFEMLTGRRPFAGDSMVSLMRGHLMDTPPSPSDSVEGLPPAVDALVGELLAKEPAGRPPTAAAAAERLEAVVAASPGELARAASARAGGRRALVAVAALALAATVGLAAVAGARDRGAPVPVAEEPAAAAVETEAPSREAPAEAEPALPQWWRALERRKEPRPRRIPTGIVLSERPGEYINEKDGSVLVWVRGGEATFGWNGGRPDEGPEVRIRLRDYFIGKHEVTAAQFARFVEQTSHRTAAETEGGFVVPWGAEQNLSASKSPELWETDAIRLDPARTWRSPHGEAVGGPPGDHPVVQVTRADAYEYARWAGLTLPSEAQWERAAGDGTAAHRFPWGDAAPGADGVARGNFRDESVRDRDGGRLFAGYRDDFVLTSPVGRFPEGASPAGALDMLGNVWEWCRDDRGTDHGWIEDGQLDPVGRFVLGAQNGMVRGGSFSFVADRTRISYRDPRRPDFRGNDLGFRLVLDRSEATIGRWSGKR